jgi:hypothetical protein
VGLHAVEGLIWLEKNYFSSRADAQKYSHLRALLKITETDPNLLALSPHMMIAGKKASL